MAVFFSRIVAIGYREHFPGDVTVFASQFISITANVWLFILIGIVFYFMMKCVKLYFHAPLINNSMSLNPNKYGHDNQLNSHIDAIEYKKLYAIIFSATFCCVINGTLWDIYFNIFVSFSDVRQAINDYYAVIFSYMVISITINYVFLYYVAQRYIHKTYSWIPVSSLLTASAITFVLFGILAIVISSFMIPFMFISNSILLFILWFIMSYALLYLITRFAIRRYFA